ncbi:MAG: hypothetical protein NTY35_08965 [Planctomycetota bacterium]|nr:hypothetical protein [Planctomycetota bacterium]
MPRSTLSPRPFSALLAVALAVCAPSAIAVLAARSAAREEPHVVLAPHASTEDPHEEMLRLFGRVERRQREIDEILGRAREPSGAGGADLAGLLKDSESRSHEVLEDIDRILELASHECRDRGT